MSYTGREGASWSERGWEQVVQVKAAAQGAQVGVEATGLTMESGGLWTDVALASRSALGGILRAPHWDFQPLGAGSALCSGGRVQDCGGKGRVLFLPFLGKSGSLSEFTTRRAIMLKSNRGALSAREGFLAKAK